MGIRHTHLGAGRPVKHPGRNLQPTVRIGAAQAAAKNSATRPLDRRVNADPKTKPRMPWVQRFSKLGSVGVLKLCCTTRFTRTRLSDIVHPVSSSQLTQDPDRVRSFGATTRRAVNRNDTAKYSINKDYLLRD